MHTKSGGSEPVVNELFAAAANGKWLIKKHAFIYKLLIMEDYILFQVTSFLTKNHLQFCYILKVK